jgi:electron transfer flavoprotein beta subunit
LRALNMVVCIKPVPDQRYWDRIRLDPKTKVLLREGIPAVINPLDKNALEEALRVRETRGGKITVISMGPANTIEVLASVFALGVDEAVLLSDPAFAGADTLATAHVLAAGIKKLASFDLIFMGQESIDGSTAQVGPQVAEILEVPSATQVQEVTFVDDNIIRVKSKIDVGYMMIEMKLPAVVAVSKGINKVRLTPIFGALWATEKKAKVLSVNDLDIDKNKIGLSGSPTYVADVININIQRKGEVIKGEPQEIAMQLIEKLRVDGVLPMIHA